MDDSLLSSDESDLDYESAESDIFEEESGDAASDVEYSAEGIEEDGIEDVAEWLLVAAGADVRPTEPPAFLGAAGVRPGWIPPHEANGNEAAFIMFYLPAELFESIRAWTNERARTFIERRPEQELTKVILEWKDCTADEIQKVVGIILLMGLDKKPEMSMYWSKDPLYHCAYLSEPHSLSRDRFKQILTCLRFYSTADPAPRSSYSKIRPLLDFVKRTCQSNYMPAQQLSVDETLVMYKGRVQFRQYIPTKRSKYGIKIYCLCESSSGYLWNFEVHTTPQDNARFGEGLGCDALSISERVVAELCRDLLDLGHHVFTDSWFTSCRLADWLLTRGTLLTGTVRCNRGPPALLRAVNLQPTSSAFARKESVLACKFVDATRSGTKTVYMLDTFGVAHCQDVHRVKRGGEQEVVPKPTSVIAYSRHMGGVDKMDSTTSHYMANRKALRWFHKLGFHMIALLVRNAWIFYRLHGGSLSHLHFLRRAVDMLVAETGDGRRRGPKPTAAGDAAAPAAAAAPRHSPSKAQRPADGQARPRRRCRVCKQRTVFICSQCTGTPSLCLGACFDSRH